jgi:hypothetical protein
MGREFYANNARGEPSGAAHFKAIGIQVDHGVAWRA